ncbi:MAG: TylF/MycF/NovP-related O-methyltransferase [Patescibacteria group bacterium]
MNRLTHFIQFLILKPEAIFAIPGIRRIRGYTMQTIAGVYQMREHIRHIIREDIRGAIVETGSWKGGLGAYMAQFGRETWLFDSFEGLPPMTEKDAEITGPKGLATYVQTGYIAVPEKMAREIAAKLGVKPHIIKGWFNESLPKYKNEIGPIAVLRLDGDTYDSTIDALNILYESVVKNGIVVIDDYYDFRGCREAIYDFFTQNKIAPAIHRYPFGRAYFVKG